MAVRRQMILPAEGRPPSACRSLRKRAHRCRDIGESGVSRQSQTRGDGEHQFFVPNAGLLYPAVYDLAERGLASTKVSTLRLEKRRCKSMTVAGTGE